jgi:transposase InsO family protein
MVASVGWSEADDDLQAIFDLEGLLVASNEVALEMDEIVKFPERELKKFIQERMNKTAVLDSVEQAALLRAAHADGHFGAEELFKTIWRKGFFWPGLRKQCREVVGLCRSCLQYNIGREGFHPVQSLRADGPWDHIAVDCAVALPESVNGFKHLLIMVDVATRYVVTKPLKDMTMKTLARALYEVFALFGPPKAMQSDNGSEFINQLVKELTAKANVDHRTVVPWNPRANGLAERTVQTVKATLKKTLAGAFEHWDEALAGATMAINSKESDLTKTAPFTLFFGRSPNAWQDYTLQELQLAFGPQDVKVLEELRKRFEKEVRPAVHEAAATRQDKVNAKLNKKRSLVQVDYPPGALVMAKVPDRASKLEPPWVGPYMVVRKSNRSQTYTLRDQNNKVLARTFAISQLKFVADTRVPLTSASGEVLDDLDVEHAVVDCVLERRFSPELGQTEYLVRWKGFSSDHDQWCVSSDFDDASFLTEYNNKMNPGRKRQRKS